jgi:hypothetical protein
MDRKHIYKKIMNQSRFFDRKQLRTDYIYANGNFDAFSFSASFFCTAETSHCVAEYYEKLLDGANPCLGPE